MPDTVIVVESHDQICTGNIRFWNERVGYGVTVGCVLRVREV